MGNLKRETPQKLSIQTGLKCFQPYDDDEDVIYFNPGDPNMLIRLDEAMDRIKTAIKDMPENLQDNDVDDTNDTKTTVDKVKQVNELIEQQINHIFGCDASSVLFKRFSPLSVSGGVFLIDRILEAFAPYIEKETKLAQAEQEKRIERYTKKHHK